MRCLVGAKWDTTVGWLTHWCGVPARPKSSSCRSCGSPMNNKKIELSVSISSNLQCQYCPDSIVATNKFTKRLHRIVTDILQPSKAGTYVRVAVHAELCDEVFDGAEETQIGVVAFLHRLQEMSGTKGGLYAWVQWINWQVREQNREHYLRLLQLGKFNTFHAHERLEMVGNRLCSFVGMPRNLIKRHFFASIPRKNITSHRS